MPGGLASRYLIFANKTECATESGRETSMNFESRHPATGELIGPYPEHDKAEIDVPFWQVLRFFNTTALVGNTAIVKHAESVQGCAEALETLVRDAGGPEGLYVNLAIHVPAVAAVIADPRVRAATVTGSVRAGRAVAAEAAQAGKR